MRRLRHGIGKILILHRVVRLGHRRLHEALAAAREFAVLFGQFHDAEQLIAKPREFMPQQPRGIFQPALTPDPAVPFQRQPQPGNERARREEQSAKPCGSFDEPIQAEHQQVGNGETEHRSEQTFGEFHDPNAAAELRELG